MKDLDKYRGCLVGGAAGDALGYAVEFWGEEHIFSRYGERGITEYELDAKGVAHFSDDTQMTLFTANGLLLGTTRGMTRGIMGPYESYVSYCYGDWYRTQTESIRSTKGGVASTTTRGSSACPSSSSSARRGTRASPPARRGARGRPSAPSTAARAVAA